MNIPKLFKIEINGTDVSSYLYSGNFSKTRKQPVKEGTFLFKKSINTTITVDDTLIGKSFTVQRGFISATERYKFRGEITGYNLTGSLLKITVADKLYGCVKREYDYTFDKNTDTEAGVGSEIVKTLISVPGLSYTAASIPTTGTDAAFVLNDYPAKGAIIDTLKDLNTTYNRDLFYRDSDDLVYWIPESFETTSTIIQVGVNVKGRIEWKTTGTDMVNNLTIVGSEQLDWNTETFTPTVGQTVFTLTAKPVDTEIYVNSVLQSRGVNSSDPKDFYVITDQRQVVFTVSPFGSSVEINYSYNVPVKVQVADDASISANTQRDLTLINSRLSNTDDAELNAINIITQSTDALTNAPITVIGDNELELGQVVRVVDAINDKDENLVIQSIGYTLPYGGDSVTVGKLPTNSTDIQLIVIDNIKKLQRQLSSDTDVNVQLISNSNHDEITGYTKIEIAKSISDVLYYNTPTGLWTSLNWGIVGDEGTPGVGETYGVQALYPLNNSVFEDFRSTEFKEASTTATWTTAGSCTFTAGQIAVGGYYYKDSTSIVRATLVVDNTTNLTFYLSVDGSNWEAVTNNIPYNFVRTGEYLYWKAEASDTATLNTVRIQFT